jgi:hypothetical protein
METIIEALKQVNKEYLFPGDMTLVEEMSDPDSFSKPERPEPGIISCALPGKRLIFFPDFDTFYQPLEE